MNPVDRRALRLEDDGREVRRPAREDPMNNLIRQTHRWLSIAFTLTVIANFAAMTRGQPPAWLTYSPLLPLAFLLLTGLYLFALPYAARWRSGRRSVSAS
jgi:cellulose synthase/poly-beta-1,6-N-acetylglucosamine synthase-like glycosyltransferase